ncbi:hypothetical protein [Streptomyces sp. NPDC057682]|uniref:hypothetical protein n=1 Tax=Streptomyces sp. NPDC057682 TaxID=3346210 RepID=UPI0036770563
MRDEPDPGNGPAATPPYAWTPERMRASRPLPLPSRPPWPGRDGDRARLPAAALDLTAPPERCRRAPEGARVWTLLLPEQGPAEEAAGAAALTAGERRAYAGLEPGPERRAWAVVRGGLRLLAAAHLGCSPDRITVLDGPCPLCARWHDGTAAGGDGGPLRLSWERCGGLVVYALSTTTVGVGVVRLPEDGDPAAVREAHRAARLAAGRRALIRGGCAAGPGVTGDRSVERVAVPDGYGAAVVRHMSGAGAPGRSAGSL